VDCPIGVEHHILHEIFGVVVVTAVFERQDVQAPVVLRGQPAKSVGISTLSSGNQLCLFSR